MYLDVDAPCDMEAVKGSGRIHSGSKINWHSFWRKTDVNIQTFLNYIFIDDRFLEPSSECAALETVFGSGCWSNQTSRCTL